MIYLNDTIVETGRFPNGETWVNVRDVEFPYKAHNQIKVMFESNDDLINLMFLKRHLDEQGYNARLVIEYFPYSRMDRRNEHYAFSLKYIAEFINSLNFDAVKISEPHSDVTPALLDRVKVRQYVVRQLEYLYATTDIDLLFYPDAGSVKRYTSLVGEKYCYANKERDFKTGKIIKYEIVAPNDVTPKHILIVDDLCSRGGTFLEAGRQLKKHFGDTVKVSLLVAHVEDNIFSGELLAANSPIDHIYCSSSLIRTQKSEKITVFN